MKMKASILLSTLFYLILNSFVISAPKNDLNLTIPGNSTFLGGGGSSSCYCDGQALKNGSFEYRKWVDGKSVPDKWNYTGDFVRRSNYVVCDYYNGFLTGGGSFYQDVYNIGEGDKVKLSIWGGYHYYRNHFFKLIFIGASGEELSEVVQKLTKSVAQTGGKLTQYWLSGVAPKGAVKVRVMGCSTGDYFKVDAACLKVEKCPLPVNLIGIKATVKENSVQILWSTSAETNAGAFDVEQSTTRKSWKSLGSVAAKGESSQTLEYDFVHSNPGAGNHLYRLKMIDLDGTYTYSRIVEVKIGGSSEITVFPNPTTDYVTILATRNNLTNVRIYRAEGGLVKTVSGNGLDKIDLKGLSSGSYILSIQDDSGAVTTKRIEVAK